MQNRRIMSEEEKRAYEKKATGRLSPFEKLARVGKMKKMVSTALVAIAVVAVAGFVIYQAARPTRFRDVIGSDYVSVQWSNGSGITADEVKTWSVERAYPGSINKENPTELTFYNEDGVLVGSVTFTGSDGLFIHQGEAYTYSAPEKE